METKTASVWKVDQKMYIVYCTIAGFISVWAISGLLMLVDYISGTPSGTFFAVIGISLGINDPVTAQYVGFGLHLLTGTVAGNIYGQVSIFWRKIAPNSYRHGIKTGLVVGIALWAILFVPLATFGIQPKLDSFVMSAPNQYIFEIASQFQGLFPIIILGSLVFHLVYGILLGFLAGRMTEVRTFVSPRKGVS
ncbi:MAG TPA: hypothetical protein VE130_05110 [Nitrososphaeraceae archaeon]|nr:hypothetical protein [Nitrososphaeraceae archaeon]